MKKRYCVLIALFISVVCSYSGSYAQEYPELVAAKAAIAKSNSIYFTAFAKGDSSIFIERYAKDCCIMPPNTPALCGPDAALQFFRVAYYQIGLRNGKFITTNVYGNGDGFVTEEGLWQSFDANNNLTDDGKFLVLWKKTAEG